MKCFIILIILVTALSGCRETPKEASKIKIGMTLYQSDDAFIASIKDKVVKLAKETEIRDNIKITISVADAGGEQATQYDQVDVFIAQGYNVICVNMVDRTAASLIIDKAKAANVPVVFFNREPVSEDMERWDHLYYVGAKAEQSGAMQGRLIADAYFQNPGIIDKNGDGVIQYVMMEGELGHQDALLRTEYSVRTIMRSGIKMEKLANDSAVWKRSLGKEKMSNWLSEFGSQIEVVFCNNDEMALGAIDAVKEAGYSFTNNYEKIIIVGIDATAAGLEAVKQGYMFATVLNDAAAQSQAVFDIAYSVASNKKASTSVEGFDGKYLRANYQPVSYEDSFGMQ